MSDHAPAAAETALAKPSRLWLWGGLAAAVLLTAGVAVAAVWPWPARVPHTPPEKLAAVAALVPPRHTAAAAQGAAVTSVAEPASSAASAARHGLAAATDVQPAPSEDPMQRLLRRLNALGGVHAAADTGAPGELRLTTRAQAGAASANAGR